MADASPSRGPERSPVVPCTLCSHHYHYGAGALANSLYRNGYRGTLYVGYQPPFPKWADATRRDGDKSILEVAPDFSIEFIPWPSDLVLSMEKPNFLLHVMDRLAPEATAVVFFDADVVIKGSWHFFENWAARGIALCLDASYPLVPEGHPWRAGWRKLAANEAFVCRDIKYYFAGAFIGVPRAYRDFAACWAKLTTGYVLQEEKTFRDVKFNTREDPIAGDQDILNAAVMATKVPLSIIGQEAMDFTPAGYVMSAVIDARKPWQKSYLASALTARPPSMADKMYWHYADSPIRLFSRARVTVSRIALKTASFVGRFYARQ